MNEKMDQLNMGKIHDQTQENGVRETNAPPTGEKYSVNEDFATEIDIWYRDGMKTGEQFVLGTTGDVLQALGAIESDIYMLGDKISKILEDHPEMSLEEIKKIPQILEDSVLILKSRNVGRGNASNTRLVAFGTIKAQNGKPVLAVLDMRPVENHLVIDDMQKITSAYTKDNPVTFIRNSEVLYADEKRTAKLLRTIGFYMPIELQQSGYIGNISYVGQNVNINGVPFLNVAKEIPAEGNIEEEYALSLPTIDNNEVNGDSERYSVDDPGGENFADIQAELEASNRQWSEMFLQDRLGEEGAEKYRQWQKQQAEQKKQQDREKNKTRREEEQKLRREVISKMPDKKPEKPGKVTKPVAESKPILAKKELRNSLTALFSIPEGQLTTMGQMIDGYADRLLKNGELTDADRKALFDRMYESGVMVVQADDYFSTGRNILQGGRIYVPQRIRTEFGDNWKDIRRRAFVNGIYFTEDKNAVGIDTWNGILAEELPGLFDAEDTDLSLILERIVQLAEEGRDNKIVVEVKGIVCIFAIGEDKCFAPSSRREQRLSALH